MSSETWFLLARGLLLAMSFVGLCAGLRVLLKLDRFVAPFVAVSGVIAALMLGGMAGVLSVAFWLLYALGFLGLIYAYFIRRVKPAYGLIAAMLVFCVFLVWRFYPCPLYRNDDVSHWGLVARHLLRYDRFPNGDDSFVFFQSYPLGAASFIYYVARSLINSEGLYLVAQNFLLGALFLPMFSLIRENRRLCYPIAAAIFLLFFHFFRNMIDLQVDTMLAFFGMGLCACAARYRNDLKRALISVLPGMIAVVYVKNSGMFFAACAAFCLAWSARGDAKSSNQNKSREQNGGAAKKRALRTALFAVAVSVAAYLLWIVHLKFAFAAALESKHAVSLSAYAAQAASKGMGTILRIVGVILRKAVSIDKIQLIALAYTLGAGALLIWGCLKLPDQRGYLKRAIRLLVAGVCAYLVWFVLMVFMYIFSMPKYESLIAAGFHRYNSTGLLFMMGLITILLFSFFCDRKSFDPRQLLPLRLAQIASVICLAGFCLLLIHPVPGAFGRILFRNTQYSPIRAGLISAHEQYHLPEGGRYLFYVSDDRGVGPYTEYYHVKYEFETGDILLVSGVGPYLSGTHAEGLVKTDDARAYVEAHIDDCDAFFILNSSPDFEAQLEPFLKDYAGDTPIIRLDL